ncbi:SMI1/KNR4 family protein [Tumebacillus flagellatus]|uniref:Cell wall assembly protein n=1 Tax=Tumebacillus flagellatus TaxID=1157490 RepID=A0A074LPP9_9BACL|nr:SMI1/KNR4 family protein [Tumebacillus flagellatus]KEO81833.1 cell wall assembly protein [Tumebacillus flagellatus]
MKFLEESILPPPTDQRLKSFERACRVELPSEFHDLLKTYHGATPITNVFHGKGREFLIERLLCLLEDPASDETHGWYDIEVVLSQIDTRLTDDENLVGANVIPFASLFAGDFVCLDLRNQGKQSVVVWLHEESEDFNPVFLNVAGSLSEFFSMLSE